PEKTTSTQAARIRREKKKTDRVITTVTVVIIDLTRFIHNPAAIFNCSVHHRHRQIVTDCVDCRGGCPVVKGSKWTATKGIHMEEHKPWV
ncbi:hypothetical protein M8C21_009188, partial [Ambrosia artemisiifolia]